MKKLLAIALASVVVATSPVSALAAENGGSSSITTKDLMDKLNQMTQELKDIEAAIKAKDPTINITNNPTNTVNANPTNTVNNDPTSTITNNPNNTTNATNNPTTTNYNDNNNAGTSTNTVGGNTITNTNNSSSDTTVTNTSTSTASSEGGGGGTTPAPVPVPVPVPVPGGGGGGGSSSSSSSTSNCVTYNGCSVYACKKIEINGCKSNATFMVNGVDSGTVKSAKDLAKNVGGNLVSCIETSAPGVVFSTAKVNFFVGGVLDGDNIAVYQLQNGKWVQLSVSEIRKDHVVVNMTKHGKLAFVRVPALAKLN